MRHGTLGQHVATLASALFVIAFGVLAGRESRRPALDSAAEAMYACSSSVEDARLAVREANDALELRLATLRRVTE